MAPQLFVIVAVLALGLSPSQADPGACALEHHDHDDCQIARHRSDRLLVAQHGSNPGPLAQVVAPTCPSGYVFSRGQCVRDVAPAPTCPAGFVLSGGQCVRAAEPAPVPQTAEFTIHRGFDLYGNDYAKLPGRVRYEDCLSACQRDGRCHAFTYNTKFSKCFLKSQGTNLTPFQNAISGVRNTKVQQPEPSGYGGFNAYIIGLKEHEIVSMRSNPSRGRNKIGVIPASADNIYVHWCDKYDGILWCDVDYNGIRGWILGEFLQNVEGG